MENDILINIVEIINPELRITLWNSSVIKKEKRSKRTSATIKIVKNCSKKILLIFEKELIKSSLGKKIFNNHFFVKITYLFRRIFLIKSVSKWTIH